MRCRSTKQDEYLCHLHHFLLYQSSSQKIYIKFNQPVCFHLKPWLNDKSRTPAIFVFQKSRHWDENRFIESLLNIHILVWITARLIWTWNLHNYQIFELTWVGDKRHISRWKKNLEAVEFHPTTILKKKIWILLIHLMTR